MWEICRRFTFAEGRPASHLLAKDTDDLTEQDVVAAFMPYMASGEWTDRVVLQAVADLGKRFRCCLYLHRETRLTIRGREVYCDFV